MTDRSERERNQRALDALIVSQLRRHEKSDEVDIEHLPQLTIEEKNALNSLGSNFIDRVIAGEFLLDEDDSSEHEDNELLCAGGINYGMNRAEEVDEETECKLDEKRKEVIERLKKEKEKDND